MRQGWKGAGWGLTLSGSLGMLLYVSPLRFPILNTAGREFPALKRTMEYGYLSLQERERQITVASEAQAAELRAVQDKAWSEYVERRTRLTEWAEASRLSGKGFGLWISDLRIWLFLFGATFTAAGAWIGNSRKSPPEIPSPPSTTRIPEPVARPARSDPATAALSLNLFREDDDVLLPHGQVDGSGPSAAESPWGKMPPTTEFERLERRREEVLRHARRGMTPAEIARRLHLDQEQVDLIIRQRREKG